MRTFALGLMAPCLFAFVTNSVISSAAQSPANKKPPKVITLSGCVERDEKSPQQFVIKDSQEGTYRISGKDFREYLGRRVTVDGGAVVKGFVVKGGLQPTPNIAAQAGALDPSRAAVQAATAQSTTGPDESALPEFRVKKIATATGQCSQP
jgi:hypothetical protein